MPVRSILADDSGEFRFLQVPPGRYYLSAARGRLQVSPGRTTAPVYYPNGQSVNDATPVDLRAGSTMTRVDLRVRDVVSRTISGTVVDRNGNPVANGTVTPLEMHSWARTAAEAASCSQFQSDGAFWKVHDALFEEQEAITLESIEAKILDIVKGIPGFDVQSYSLHYLQG